MTQKFLVLAAALAISPIAAQAAPADAAAGCTAGPAVCAALQTSVDIWAGVVTPGTGGSYAPTNPPNIPTGGSSSGSGGG